MTDQDVSTVDLLISEFRHGRPVLLLLDSGEDEFTGVVAMAAEFCTAEHVNFMARQARGLVCLSMTRERCEHLHLPLMVEGGPQDNAPFTLSIEAAVGIDTGISAADRALTIKTAVAADAKAADLVQPGHIFPMAAVDGGLLIRTGVAEATTDLAALAGLMPSGAFAEVLDSQGNLADGESLMAFAKQHELAVGRVSDLVNYRLLHHRSIARIREGQISTRYGDFHLTVYREATQGQLHFAFVHGQIDGGQPTVVRVHATSLMRDLVGTRLAERATWRFGDSLAAIAKADSGVLVLLGKTESADGLLQDIDRILGVASAPITELSPSEGIASVGLGAQILSDLGVGKIELLGAPLKYNALAGFGLEVVGFVEAQDSVIE